MITLVIGIPTSDMLLKVYVDGVLWQQSVCSYVPLSLLSHDSGRSRVKLDGLYSNTPKELKSRLFINWPG